MRIRRTLPIVLAVVIVAAALILAVQLRKQAPPECARLLPAADAFLYANLGWARKTNSEKSLLPIPHDSEYERFIRETGFDYERDLESVAFAVHYPQSWPGGGTAGAAPEPRFSEVFLARFDGTKCSAYLKHTCQVSGELSLSRHLLDPFSRTNFPHRHPGRGYGGSLESR